MPELPEVETIVRTLSPMVMGKVIESVHVLNHGSADGPHDPATLVGGRIIRLARRGKLVLMHTKDCAPPTPITGLAVHLKMTGRLFVYPCGTPPGPHTRVILDLSGGQRLFFDDARKFGYLRVLSAESYAQWPFWNSLGPEPLDMDAPAFTLLFAHRNAGMKALLLDQHVIAGIGNIYADESLFRAGIHPRTRASALSPLVLQSLHTHLVDVLNESIEACGSSIRDYRTARGDAGAFQNAFRVYGRAGKPCIVCGQALETATIAGRTTVFCGHCQRELPCGGRNGL